MAVREAASFQAQVVQGTLAAVAVATSLEDEIESRIATGLTPVAREAPRARVWAVGGGKGGVGKSLISANFALSLARRGKKVLAVDLDLGGANLHTCLGIEPPKRGLGDWATGRVTEVEELFVNSEPGLRILSGSNDALTVIHRMEGRRDEFWESLRRLEADEIILDLGAGTSDFTIDFFNRADEGIVSILPEPTSVENAYRFVRAVIFRRLRNAEVPPGIREVVDAATDQKNILGIKTPMELLAVVERLDAVAAQDLRARLEEIHLNVVMNQVRSPIDIDVGRAICSVCKRYFGLDVNYAGYLDYDNTVWKAIREKKPVVRDFPHSILANRLDRLARTLLGEQKGLFP